MTDTAASPATADIAAHPQVASFWRRLVAFSVDAMVIGAAGTVVAIPAFDILVHLGPWGRVLGFFVSMPYFALMESRFGNGQTFGKKWLHIRVVDRGGNALPFGKCLLRYVVFAVPYFFNGNAFPPGVIPSATIYLVVSTLIFGVAIANLYFVMFNRHTRQGLHDLAVGSYVVKTQMSGQVNVPPVWNIHWLVGGAIVLLALAGTLFMPHVTPPAGLSPLFEATKAIDALPGVRSSTLGPMFRGQIGKPAQSGTIATVILDKAPADKEALENEIVKIVLDRDPKAKDGDFIDINLVRGFDLGITSWNMTYRQDLTPTEWQSRISASPPTEPAK